MSIAANLSKQDPVKLALAAALVLGVLYVLTRQAVADVAGAAGGIVSGENAATKGTPYEGKGVAGTLGAVTNAASGGLLQAAGEKLGGWIYDLTHLDYQP